MGCFPDELIIGDWQTLFRMFYKPTFTCCTLVLLGQGSTTITGRGLQTWIFSTAAEIWRSEQEPTPRSPAFSASRAECADERWWSKVSEILTVSLFDITGCGQTITSCVWGATVQERLRWDLPPEPPPPPSPPQPQLPLGSNRSSVLREVTH